MNEQLKKYFDPVKNFWLGLSKKNRVFILSGIGGVILVAVVAQILLNMDHYVILYSGLDDTETQEIVAVMDTENTNYKKTDDGTIYVLGDEEATLRMEFANLGYPKTTLNYDFFTKNVDVMTTDYEKKVIEQYQLNQRLEAVIETFDVVKDASVTIAIPDSNSYAWNSDAAQPTASVSVQLTSNKSLESSQVNGIKQLVAKSVPDLSAENVTVIDVSTGNELDSSNSSAGNMVDISEFKLAIEEKYESKIEASVRKVLSPIFGDENIQITAKSVMNVDQTVKEIITYTPSGNGNTGVISSATDKEEQEKSGDSSSGAVVGTETNTEGTTTYAGVTADGNTLYVKDEETYQYLVSQATEQIEKDAASVDDLTISVAINQRSIEADQKAEIIKLIAFSAAISTDKVAVYNTAFLQEEDVPVVVTDPKTPAYMKWLPLGLAALACLFFILMMIFLMVSRRRKKKLKRLLNVDEEENPTTEMDNKASAISTENEMAAKERRVMEEIHAAQQSRDQELRKGLQEFTEQNPEIVAQLIRPG